MGNAWLLRPNPDGNKIKEFVNENFIAIGWGKVGNISDLDKDEIKNKLVEEYFEKNNDKDDSQSNSDDGKFAHWLSRALSAVNIFVKSMNIGDLVLVPNGEDIHICEIASDYYFENENTAEGFPHRRKVVWKRRVLRQNLTQELRSSLRVLRTTACFTKYYDEIKHLAYQEKYIDRQSIRTLNISFPLRSDFIINVEVPTDLSKAEATRLSDFFARSYFVD